MSPDLSISDKENSVKAPRQGKTGRISKTAHLAKSKSRKSRTSSFSSTTSSTDAKKYKRKRSEKSPSEIKKRRRQEKVLGRSNSANRSSDSDSSLFSFHDDSENMEMAMAEAIELFQMAPGDQGWDNASLNVPTNNADSSGERQEPPRLDQLLEGVFAMEPAELPALPEFDVFPDLIFPIAATRCRRCG